MKNFLIVILIFTSFALYSKTIVKVTPNSTKTNGKKWDGFGGAPDIYIKIDGKSYKHQKCQNSFSCKFTVDTITEPVSIELIDKDAVADDSMGTTFCMAPTATQMAGCETESVKIIIYNK